MTLTQMLHQTLAPACSHAECDELVEVTFLCLVHVWVYLHFGTCDHYQYFFFTDMFLGMGLALGVIWLFRASCSHAFWSVCFVTHTESSSCAGCVHEVWVSLAY
jgi:hypothetical protein